jgi:hypothetical protein
MFRENASRYGSAAARQPASNAPSSSAAMLPALRNRVRTTPLCNARAKRVPALDLQAVDQFVSALAPQRNSSVTCRSRSDRRAHNQVS